MNDLERLLLTVGDLELARRQLAMRVQELEAENVELKAQLNGGGSKASVPDLVIDS